MHKCDAGAPEGPRPIYRRGESRRPTMRRVLNAGSHCFRRFVVSRRSEFLQRELERARVGQPVDYERKGSREVHDSRRKRERAVVVVIAINLYLGSGTRVLLPENDFIIITDGNSDLRSIEIHCRYARDVELRNL